MPPQTRPQRACCCLGQASPARHSLNTDVCAPTAEGTTATATTATATATAAAITTSTAAASTAAAAVRWPVHAAPRRYKAAISASMSRKSSGSRLSPAYRPEAEWLNSAFAVSWSQPARYACRTSCCLCDGT